MASGLSYANYEAKSLVGVTDLRDGTLEYLRLSMREHFMMTYQEDGVFGTLGLSGDGGKKFKIDGVDFCTDGQGYLFDIDTFGHCTGVAFENAAGIPYYVALKFEAIPTGIQINPRSGMPEWESWEEGIGQGGEPDSVTVVSGHLVMVVDGITETGVSNAERRVLVYKKVLDRYAILTSVAMEELTVQYTGGQNIITTSAKFGQFTASTDPADYRVVLLGPTVKRNTDLRLSTEHCFIGIVTGIGGSGTPTTFDTADQQSLSGSLSQLWQITRQATNGRMKVDVKSIAGESGEDQIRVTNTATSTIVFTVDEAGNVYLAGDLEVAGQTTQQNLVQVNSSETITDNLTAGDNDAVDSHTIKGTWLHTNTAGTAYHFYVNGSTGQVGIGVNPSAGWDVHIGGDTKIDGVVRSESIAPLYQWSETDATPTTGGLWRLMLNTGNIWFQENTAVSADFATSKVWWFTSRANNRIQFGVDVTPQADDTSDLGVSGLEWRNLYVDGVAYLDTLSLSTTAGEGVATSIHPIATDTYNLGSATYRWNDVHARTITLDNTIGYGVGSNLAPTADNTYSIGTATRRWSSLYVNTLVFSGNFLPLTDNAQDVGSATYRWRDSHFSGTMTIHNNNIVPAADSVGGVGTLSYRWYDVHAMRLYASEYIFFTTDNTTDIGYTTTYGKSLYMYNIYTKLWQSVESESLVRPLVTNAVNFGTTSYRWGNMCGSGIDVYANSSITTAGKAFNVQAGTSYDVPSTEEPFARISDLATISTYPPYRRQTFYVQAASRFNAANVWQEYYGAFIDFKLGVGAASSEITEAAALYIAFSHTTTEVTYIEDLYGLYIATHSVGASVGGVYGLYVNEPRNVSAAAWYSAYIIGNTTFISGGGTSTVELRVTETVHQDIRPYTDNTYDFGTSSYRVRYLRSQRFVPSTVAGEGCFDNFVPAYNNSLTCGSSSYYWSMVYAETFRWKTAGTTFDNIDDLALIDGYEPNGDTIEVEKGGEKRTIVKSNNSLPWPMLAGEKSPDGEHFMDMADSATFLIGAIKQLHAKHKTEVSNLKEMLAAMESRLAAVESCA